MTNKVKRILKNHIHWINKDCDGWESMRADLSNANLNGVNLKGVNLSGANLKGANLSFANLNNANLSNVDLRYANLRNADLTYVDFIGANFSEANLNYANLNGADLKNVNFSNASLNYANLNGADLRCVNFSKASLKGANLTNTDLRSAVFIGADFRDADFSKADFSNVHYRSFHFYNADLRGAKGIPFIPYACPETGSFIGYKKARNGIVELEIPADARRSSATGRRCRCDKAKVLGIYDNEHNLYSIKETVSNFKPSFVYRVGEIVEEPDFCTDRWDEFASGIHFFLSFQEAVVYG